MTEPMTDQSSVSSPSVAESPKTSKKRSPLLIAIIVILVLLVLAGGTAALAYDIYVRRSDDVAASFAARLLPIPAAKVGSRTVLYRAYLDDRAVVKKFLASPAAAAQEMSAPFDATIEKGVFEKLLAETVINEFATQQQIVVTDDEVQKYYDDVVSVASSTTPDMGAFLRDNYGWNEADFRERALRPALLQDKLGQKMMDENNGDPGALAAAIEKRLAESDVIRYLKF